MSLFNDNLKNIKIRNLAIFILVSYSVLFILGRISFPINEKWLYVALLLYFIFKLRDSIFDFKTDLMNVFSKVQLKYILIIVFTNIFFSYGMLYFTNALIGYFPTLQFLVEFSIPSMSIAGSLPLLGTFISTVVISPIVEELIFRGVLLNRLRLITPVIFSLLASSLLFGALHSFGGIISAFVFGICMGILYIKTNNICVAILAHFLNNLFAEIIKLLDFGNLLFTNGEMMSIVSVLAIVSFIILLSSIIKELNKIK